MYCGQYFGLGALGAWRERMRGIIVLRLCFLRSDSELMDDRLHLKNFAFQFMTQPW